MMRKQNFPQQQGLCFSNYYKQKLKPVPYGTQLKKGRGGGEILMKTVSKEEQAKPRRNRKSTVPLYAPPSLPP